MKNIKLLFAFLLAVGIVGCSSSDSNFSYGSAPTTAPIYNRCFGGDLNEMGYSVCVSTDGTVWVTGETKSTDGDVPNTKHGITENSDLWLLGIDTTKSKDKQIIYNRCFGGDLNDIGLSVCVSTDGTVWVTGYTDSTDGDVPNTKHGITKNLDLWLLGIDPTKGVAAEPIYNRCFGGDNNDIGYSVCVSGGTVWVTGETGLTGIGGIKDANDVPDTKHNASDIWLLGINPK